ncbi:hypothetical protein CYL17_02455 [Thermobispora bispora]|nr:hypothetical protein CYL17_02455 [Thermobispora bispora]
MSPPAATWHRESEEEKAIEFGFSGHGLLDPTADDHRNGRLADEAARGRPWLARRKVHDWHVQGGEHPQDRRAPAARTRRRRRDRLRRLPLLRPCAQSQ